MPEEISGSSFLRMTVYGADAMFKTPLLAEAFPYPKISRTTRPLTSVSRKSRPAYRYVSRS